MHHRRLKQAVSGALTIIVLCLLSVLVLAQTQQQTSKDKLLNRKKKLEKEIAYNRKLLEQTGKTRQMSVSQLKLIQNQIKNREALLLEISNEIQMLNQAIVSNDELLLRQKENLRILKEEYAKIIYHEWKTHNSYDRLLFIFSAEDFNQAYRRLRYFQQYSDYRRKQADLIVEAQNIVSAKLAELKSLKDDKARLLSENETEKQKLDRERANKDAAVKKLQQQETSIRKSLQTKQNEAKKLQSRIEAIIAEEIRKAEESSRKKITSHKDLKDILTPEEKLLSNDFVSNKGKLPWPVVSGIISAYFGEHNHPVLPGIKVKNNGIDISTTKGSAARAIFNGTVTSIISISDNNKAVIIRHGDFFSVYSNLQSVSVQKGAKVSTKQNIGTVSTDEGEGKTIVHFELWQGKTLQNPSHWLAR